jgi:polyisoprenoid-binding protein YceI
MLYSKINKGSNFGIKALAYWLWDYYSFALLCSVDFLDVEKFPEANFISISYVEGENGKAILKGNLTLHGVTKAVEIKVAQVGGGKDPWGGFRRGFEGQTRIALKDFGITKNLGPASAELDLTFAFEGIKQ